MSDYAPKPNSVAARAIAYLESLPPGAEIMTTPLADAIRVPGANLPPSLEAPLTHGLLFRRQRDTHVRSPWWWSLTNYSAQPKAAWPPKPTQDAPKVEVARTPAPAPEKPRQQAESPVREAAMEPPQMRVALWSDGALVIVRGTETMALQPDETRVLVRYLERMAEVVA